MPHLSGRILKPSRGSSFAEKWTSSLVASLVSHSQPQDSGQETTTQDIFGPTSSEESESWHTLPLFSSRMLKGSSAQSSRATDGPTLLERPFCSMSSASWKDWVTEQRREYSLRVKSVRPISENECLLWVCAPISATQDALLFQRCSAPQSQQMWNTPQARDHKGVDRRKEARGFSPSLPNQVQPTQPQEAQSSTSGNRQELQWATPYAGTKDHQGGSLEHYQSRLAKGRQIDLHGQITMINEAYTGKLNPRWVETLMGLPVGWTMPSCADPWTIERMSCVCSEMESFPPQQSEPSESCGENWSTPPASQRGETLEVYFRKTIDRMKQGGVRFAPTLQVAVEAEERCIDIAKSLSLITPHLDQDTEGLVQMAMQGES